MPSKVMLITGASRGIGAKTAQLAAAQGWQVAVNFINNATAANDVVRSIQAQGGQAQAFQADVSDSDQVDRLFNDVDQAFGRLRSLCGDPADDRIIGRRRRFRRRDIQCHAAKLSLVRERGTIDLDRHRLG